MAAVPAPFLAPTTNPSSEDKSRLRPGSSLRSRQDAHDTPFGSRWRFTRSTSNLRDAASHPQPASLAPASPPPPPPPERTPSKLSIFHLFGRPRVEKARGHVEMAAPKSSLRQNPSPPTQQSVRSRSSQLFRPQSILRPATLQREFGDWEPPPLFQAFPQSVKHATIQACVFGPDALMRSQSQRRQADVMRERMDSARDLSTIAENSSDTRRLEKNHKRLISNSVLHVTTPELTNKIFMLVSAGYMLQYAGEGTFDRLPEKILKLGKDSAAFACDLVPGKHWVLQITSHAHSDTSFETGPRNSLLSRLRSQNATAKPAATSFLLVLESAEEMDAWMSAIRKEIDSLGGTKSKAESLRASSSTDGSAGKSSAEAIGHKHMVQRDADTINKVTPWETPLDDPQPSGSPRIATSDWATNVSERSASVADSTSGQSNRVGSHRQSAELSSVASTPVSQHQAQLDGLRGRSRFSFMSTATSTSGGPGTRNTSRESSPAPNSPKMGELEPMRSAMSLKSFHMNPNNGSSSRRRSMQPLPITNENFAPIHTPVKKQRHSLHSPTSAKEVEEQAEPGPAVPEKDSQHVRMYSQITAPLRNAAELCPEEAIPTREDSPVRSDMHSFSIPPRREVISPPPREPAPLPPQPARSQSSLGASPSFSSQSMSLFPSNAEARPQRRLSTMPKPYLRPLPVRPQAQHADGSMIVPRRQSSLTPTTVPAPLPLGINVSRSVTAPAKSPAVSENTTDLLALQSALLPSQPLRRPTSVQIRSDPAPFLSSSRPARAISSTPSFVPGQRAANMQALAPGTRPLQSAASIETLQRQAQAHRSHMQSFITPKRSMPGLGLAPPAPPPTMPLPTLPPNLPLPPTPPSASAPTPPLKMSPSTMSMPSSPPTMPSPTPPPTMPLPPTPPEAAAARSLAV